MEFLSQDVPERNESLNGNVGVSFTATQEAELDNLINYMQEEVNDFEKLVLGMKLDDFKENSGNMVSCLSYASRHDEFLLSNESATIVHHCKEVLRFPLVCFSFHWC